MKLRLRENSIRLRLLQSEVNQLLEMGNVSETIIFGVKPTEKLTYSLRISGETNEIFGQILNNHIEIFLPILEAENWMHDKNIVGLYSTQDIGDLMKLDISIEKDFACPTRPEDLDNADAFANPELEC